MTELGMRIGQGVYGHGKYVHSKHGHGKCGVTWKTSGVVRSRKGR